MNTERLFSTLLAIIAMALMIPAWHYTAKIAYDPLGPRPYPLLILGLLAVCSLILAVKPAHRPHTWQYNAGLVKKVLLCIAALLLYAFIFEWIGFIPATALLVYGLGRLFDGRNIPCLLTAIALSVGLYLLFDTLLDVSLPMGRLF